MFRLSFHPVFDSAPFVLTVLALLLGVLLFWGARTTRISPRRRKTLLALRILALVPLAFLLFRPIAVFTTLEKLPGVLVFLVDRSESMSVEDEMAGRSRFALVKNLFRDSKDRIAALRRDYELEVFGFDALQEPLAFEQGEPKLEKPDGKETAIGSALLHTLRSTAGKRVVGIVLMSDGSQRALPPRDQLPQDAALRLRDAMLPVYCVRFGRTGSQAGLRDVSVRDLFCNDQVFVNNELVVSGQIRVQGGAGIKVPVTLRFESSDGTLKEVGRQEFTAETDEPVLFPYRFVYKPTEPGQWKLQVVAGPMEKETIETNNELASFVRVVDGGLKVLYLEGRRRFEQKYLRVSLDSSADIHVDYWRPSPDSTVQGVGRTMAERIAMTTSNRGSLSETFFKPGEYAAYILGDIDSSAFKPEELEALTAAVSEGAGLVILAGQRALAPGGYASTPLAGPIPVRMNPLDRIASGTDFTTFEKTVAPEKRVTVPGPFHTVPAAGRSHFLTRLSIDAKKNAELWKNLPPMDYLYRADELKPGARVLAVATRSTGGEFPFLVSQVYGSGRVVLLLADGTWRWWMNGFESEHKKFWRQLVLWTAKMDEVPKGRLAIEMDRTRYAQEESVAFRVVYRAEDDTPINADAFRAEVQLPDGSAETVSLADENGTMTGTFRATGQPGDYRVGVSLVGNESTRELKKAQARFLVLARNMEMDSPGATPSTLDNIASVTGGKALDAEAFPALLDELQKKRSELVDPRETKKSLYDTWPLLVFFTTILATEWYLRKRWGLV